MRTLITLMFLLVGCGTAEQRIDYGNRIVSLDVFEPYVDMFVTQASDRGQRIDIDNLVVRFADIPQDEDDGKIILGRCFSRGVSTPTIEIDPDTWENMSMTRRHLLMFHELGHCILRRDHIEATVKRSIMNPLILSTSYFIQYEAYFLNEMFDSSTFNSLPKLLLTGEMEFNCD